MKSMKMGKMKKNVDGDTEEEKTYGIRKRTKRKAKRMRKLNGRTERCRGRR